MAALQPLVMSGIRSEIDGICRLNWSSLTVEEVIAVAWSYYYFSIQFRENVCLALEEFPTDAAVARLYSEECNTSNLSPFPGVAVAGEAMDHDEFMRRVLETFPISEAICEPYRQAGERYLAEVRALNRMVRASSMSSYEDGGLEAVFKAILKSPDYNHILIRGFRYFLTEHIRFDSDPASGHGSLSRHLAADPQVEHLWWLFKKLLLENTPSLAGVPSSRLVPVFGQA